MKTKRILGAVAAVVIGASLLPAIAFFRSEAGGEIRNIEIRARQYAFDPPVIKVRRNDEIRLKLLSMDVVHGFFLEGHDIDVLIEPGKKAVKLRHPSVNKEYKTVEEVRFVAGRTGKFRYRCSHTCGNLHPFMIGEFIVAPNYPYLAALGGAVGICIAALFLVFGDRKYT